MSAPFPRLSETSAVRDGGPRTPEGKAASSKNALKHGLAAKDVVIFGEDAVAFEDFRDGFVKRLAPADEVESFLVDRIAACAWRLRRAARVERGIYEEYEWQRNAFTKSPAMAMMVDAGGLGAFAQLARHEASIERSMLRALHELERLHAARVGKEVPVPITVDVTVDRGFTR